MTVMTNAMITVLIQRHIAPGMESTYESFARQIIQATVSMPGFISGESLKAIDAPEIRYIIVKMQHVTDWQRWLVSSQRQALVALLAPLLLEPEKISLLTH